jgi:hypothetical protein
MKSNKSKMDVSSPEYRNLVQNLLGKQVVFQPVPTLPLIPSPSPVKTQETRPLTTYNKDFSGVKDVDKIILLNLDLTSLSNVCRVNKYAAEICKDKSFWRNKIVKDFTLRGKFLWYTEYRNLYKNNPKQLYEIINRKSKIVSLSKKNYPALAKKFVEAEDFDMSKKDLQLVNEKILPNLKSLPLLRGDVIHFEWTGKYRNDGKLIWTGERAVELYSELDDYGTVPKEFAFPEFPIDHFYESIDHNNLIWISADKVQEIIKNFDERTQKSFVTDLYHSIPVIAGAKNDDEKLIHLNKQQFADYVTKFPFFDDNIDRSEFAEEGTAVVAAWFGQFDQIQFTQEKDGDDSEEDDGYVVGEIRPGELIRYTHRPVVGETQKKDIVIRNFIGPDI